MKEDNPSPPRLVLIFRWFCHPELRNYIEGDLMERYQIHLKDPGKRKVDIKFILGVLLLLRPRRVALCSEVNLNSLIPLFPLI